MLNVLLVEDNPIFRETIKQNLLEHFHSIVVEEASTGEEALADSQGESASSHLYGYPFARNQWPAIDSKDKKGLSKHSDSHLDRLRFAGIQTSGP